MTPQDGLKETGEHSTISKNLRATETATDVSILPREMSRSDRGVRNREALSGIKVKSRLVNLVLLPLRYGNKDIIRDNISECHR